MRTKFFHSTIALIPMLITPGVIYILSQSWLDFGGGEKDILLVIPYFVWAFIFFVVALVLIIKNWSFRRWLSRSAWVSVIAMLILWIVAYFTSLLGVS